MGRKDKDEEREKDSRESRKRRHKGASRSKSRSRSRERDRDLSKAKRAKQERDGKEEKIRDIKEEKTRDIKEEKNRDTRDKDRPKKIKEDRDLHGDRENKEDHGKTPKEHSSGNYSVNKIVYNIFSCTWGPCLTVDRNNMFVMESFPLLLIEHLYKSGLSQIIQVIKRIILDLFLQKWLVRTSCDGLMLFLCSSTSSLNNYFPVSTLLYFREGTPSHCLKHQWNFHFYWGDKPNPGWTGPETLGPRRWCNWGCW